MREADMSAGVTALLESWGCVVYTEVPSPCSAASADLIGRCSDRRLYPVEMKLCFTRELRQQVLSHRLISPLVYVAVAASPRGSSLAVCRQWGIGVIRWAAGTASVLLAADLTRKASPVPKYVRRVHDTLDAMVPGGVAGRPTLAGVGPAQECWGRVLEYWEQHPGATWKDIFADVANHYSNARSMQCAMSVAKKKYRTAAAQAAGGDE